MIPVVEAQLLPEDDRRETTLRPTTLSAAVKQYSFSY